KARHAEGRPQRALPLRQRKEIQSLPRARLGLEIFRPHIPPGKHTLQPVTVMTETEESFRPCPPFLPTTPRRGGVDFSNCSAPVASVPCCHRLLPGPPRPSRLAHLPPAPASFFRRRKKSRSPW